MTGVAIETECSKCFGGRINSRRMTTCTAVFELLLVPRQFVYAKPLINRGTWSKQCLSIQQSKRAVAVLLEEAHTVAATEKVFNLAGHTSQGGLTSDQGLQPRRIFALSYSGAVSVFLPRSADVVAMAKQTLITMNKF